MADLSNLGGALAGPLKAALANTPANKAKASVDKVMAAYDCNRDQAIDRLELRSWTCRSGGNEAAILAYNDANKDGRLTRTELEDGFARKAREAKAPGESKLGKVRSALEALAPLAEKVVPALGQKPAAGGPKPGAWSALDSLGPMLEQFAREKLAPKS